MGKYRMQSIGNLPSLDQGPSQGSEWLVDRIAHSYGRGWTK